MEQIYNLTAYEITTLVLEVIIALSLFIIIWKLYSSNNIYERSKRKAWEVQHELESLQKRTRGWNSSFSQVARDFEERVADLVDEAFEKPISISMSKLEDVVTRTIKRETNVSFKEFQKELNRDLSARLRHLIKDFGLMDNLRYEAKTESMGSVAADIDLLVASDLSIPKVRQDIDAMMSCLHFQLFKLIQHRSGRKVEQYVSNMPVNEIGFTSRVLSGLRYHGINFADELVEFKLTRQAGDGIGSKGYIEIQKATEYLKRYSDSVSTNKAVDPRSKLAFEEPDSNIL